MSAISSINYTNENSSFIVQEHKSNLPISNANKPFLTLKKCCNFLSKLECSNSVKKEIALEKCIDLIKNIPLFSKEQRINWFSWYNLHSLALETLKIKIHGCRDNFIITFPWHPMQIRLDQYFIDFFMQTSCGVTNRIALSMLVGPKKAAFHSHYAKTNQLDQLKSILKSKKPTLITFKIKACNLTKDDGTHLHYGGHVWTVFQATSDRFLLLNSYIGQHESAVTELNRDELLEHVCDINILSSTEIWTETIDAIYKKWFNVSHSEFCHHNFAGNTPQKPWKIIFHSIKPDIQAISQIQQKFKEALKRSYFPKSTTIEIDEELKLDDEKSNKLVDQKWLKYISDTVSFKKTFCDYLK